MCCSVLQCIAIWCSLWQCVAVCYSILQSEGMDVHFAWKSPMVYPITCCSVSQCVAVCCSVSQCVAVCCSVLQYVAECSGLLQCVVVFCSRNCMTISDEITDSMPTSCCSVWQCFTVRCSALQCVAVCCSVLQCVAVCCSVLHCVAVGIVCPFERKITMKSFKLSDYIIYMYIHTCTYTFIHT